jgi:hypothetical protein
MSFEWYRRENYLPLILRNFGQNSIKIDHGLVEFGIWRVPSAASCNLGSLNSSSTASLTPWHRQRRCIDGAWLERICRCLSLWRVCLPQNYLRRTPRTARKFVNVALKASGCGGPAPQTALPAQLSRPVLLIQKFPPCNIEGVSSIRQLVRHPVPQNISQAASYRARQFNLLCLCTSRRFYCSRGNQPIEYQYFTRFYPNRIKPLEEAQT